MNDLDEFMILVRDELGLEVTADDAGRPFDELAGWDSVHLLWLATLLERRSGQQVSLPDLLQAGNLHQVYSLVAAP